MSVILSKAKDLAEVRTDATSNVCEIPRFARNDHAFFYGG